MAAQHNENKACGWLSIGVPLAKVQDVLANFSAQEANRALGDLAGAGVQVVANRSGLRLSFPESAGQPARTGALLCKASGKSRRKFKASANFAADKRRHKMSFVAELTVQEANGGGTEIGYLVALNGHGADTAALPPDDDTLRRAAEIFLVRLLDPGAAHAPAQTGSTAQGRGAAKESADSLGGTGAGGTPAGTAGTDEAPQDSGYWWQLVAVVAVIAALAVLSRLC